MVVKINWIIVLKIGLWATVKYRYRIKTHFDVCKETTCFYTWNCFGFVFLHGSDLIYKNYSMSPRWIWSDKITNSRYALVGYNHFISTLKREKLEIKRKELALQAKEQEGRQQQFDMMNKQTRDIRQLQQQQMQQFMQMNANNDVAAPTTNSRTYGADEKVCWQVILIIICKKRTFWRTKS